MPKIGYKHTKEAIDKIKAKRATQSMSHLIGHPVSVHTRKLISTNTRNGMKKPGVIEKLKSAQIKYFSSPANREKTRIATKKAMARPEVRANWELGQANRKIGKFNMNTKIEIKIENELKLRNINYQKQSWICGFSVDFYLPEYRIIIECDGDYWHNKPGCQEKDSMKNNIWSYNGFNVYRFWEHEINTSAKDCINRLTIIPR